MLKNSDGKQSSSVSFAWISFIYVLVAITLGLIEEINVNGHIFKFRMIDPSLVLSLIGPAFSLYGYRRYIDRKFTFPTSEPLQKSQEKTE